MNAISLINEIRSLGCQITREGESLRVRPASLLTDELRAQIREHKADILALICRRCGSVYRVRESDRYLYLDCPGCTFRITNKRPSLAMGIFADSPKRPCSGCGWQGLTYSGRCGACIQAEWELEQKREK